jgi:uncharacterized protein with PQ loop repeat
MNLGQTMGLLAMIFGIIGSWGLWKQNKAVWKKNPDGRRTAESVSGVWVTTFLAMFTAFLVYGIQRESFPMKFQGWLRVGFSLPLYVGFMMYGKRSWKEWALTMTYAGLLAVMVSGLWSATLFTIFSGLGIWSSFVQAHTIKVNKSRGKVAVELQVIYLLAILAWLVYAIVRKDTPLTLVSIGFTLSYSSTICMWVKYPQRPK